MCQAFRQYGSCKRGAAPRPCSCGSAAGQRARPQALATWVRLRRCGKTSCTALAVAPWGAPHWPLRRGACLWTRQPRAGCASPLSTALPAGKNCTFAHSEGELLSQAMPSAYYMPGACVRQAAHGCSGSIGRIRRTMRTRSVRRLAVVFAVVGRSAGCVDGRLCPASHVPQCDGTPPARPRRNGTVLLLLRGASAATHRSVVAGMERLRRGHADDAAAHDASRHARRSVARLATSMRRDQPEPVSRISG
jgi:hypothetical protein